MSQIAAIILLVSIPVMIAGFVLRSQLARLTSAAVVAFTIGKVFLVDMAGLTGIFRALSFIGLGIVLIGIGWLCQRLLCPARRQATASGTTAAGPANG